MAGLIVGISVCGELVASWLKGVRDLLSQPPGKDRCWDRTLVAVAFEMSLMAMPVPLSQAGLTQLL